MRRSTRACSPSSSAAKRIAAARLPTPGGPCELAVLDLLEPVEQPPARVALELRTLVRCVRRGVAVADHEVVRRERLDEPGPRMEAVARVEQRRELRVHLVRGPELAVQVV